jgi:hypothetical protein
LTLFNFYKSTNFDFHVTVKSDVILVNRVVDKKRIIGPRRRRIGIRGRCPPPIQ